MGRGREKEERSYTLPPPPSSSSSDFEFSISISPRKSSTLLCPADELFYKGQLLPLHPSPRISMLLSSSSSSPTSTSSTSSAPRRDSSSSHSSIASDPALIPDSDSSRPSSVTLDDNFNQLHQKKPNTKYFSFSRFSSVFRKDNHKSRHPESVSSASSVKRMSNTAKDVIKKYAKPLYDKLWQKQQQQQQQQPRMAVSSLFTKTERLAKEAEVRETESVISHSFSGNLLRYPLRRRSCVSSCPSSMRSSPTHSGVLSRGGFTGGMCYSDGSTMEELQSAIQGAIAHCKNSLVQNKTTVDSKVDQF